MQKNSVLDWSLIIAIGIAWGSSFLFIKISAPEVGPITLVFSRLLIASLILTPFFITKKNLANIKEDLPSIMFLACINASIPFYLFSRAAIDLNAGTMSVLNGTTPLFAFVIASLWLRLSSNWIQLIGILIGMIGLLVFVGYESLEFSIFAIILCLLASFFYAFSSNFIFKTKQIDATYLASMTLLVATFLVFPFTFLETGLHLNHPGEVLLSVFLLGFLCTGLAYMGYVVLIKRVGPVKASTVVLIVPISGMLWANVFLGEIITGTMLIGSLLIITGVGLVNFFKDEIS
ncbi:DMT family transporter [Gammaproteobacteria bacterium]|nr:DMT family transporter [Gammaproteobacteria bacterium]MDC0577324.1 DMT family transporter [Gammaproteobacteria bacterium]MDC0590784.1 DMT family transporter [Gammaproteobacteria bacterium]